MSLSGGTRGSWKVELIEDTDLAVRVFKRGATRADHRCNLTISVNGHERLSMFERAGPAAPANVIVDLRVDPAFGTLLAQSLPGRPWLVEDMPVIVYCEPHTGESEDAVVKYLMRTPVVEQILDTIRNALDLANIVKIPTPEKRTDWPLDLAAG